MRKHALALGISLLALPAQTTTVTTQTRTGTLDFGLLLAGSTVAISFDGFGIPTQRLTEVALSFTAGAEASYIVTNVNLFGSPASRQITLVRGLQGTLTGNGFNLANSSTVSKTNSVPRPGVVNFGAFSPQVSASGAITSGFAAFGSPVSFNLNVRQFGNSLTGAPNLGATTATINPLAPLSSRYSATLTYTSVPEPSEWAMLLVGFGLIGLAARRRRLVAA